ncbi:AAA family ATPase [Sphaerospermopsis kisseleviana CS-549]|uniref:ATPase n=2 Tax=Sphaerospermopsis TaxID=752201 RepID=A0A479ZRL7_9CYAN|nr:MULTISPECIES: AAA family ATPase [Sphaerospermopsis]MDB9441571.1 AAA family ATPase [Sphaerospermopsis kisseleviana CS-549]BAZ83653.1 ATPase [Sphaerospermopsis kisseleviana NIES-73]GCL35125.1 ATPase [Sphaerospermopsis reniformis]
MKIQSLQLKYFKKFRSSPLFDFTDPETGLARDIIVLIGMNGAGKTSLLQAIASGTALRAIAATLGTATGHAL